MVRPGTQFNSVLGLVGWFPSRANPQMHLPRWESLQAVGRRQTLSVEVRYADVAQLVQSATLPTSRPPVRVRSSARKAGTMRM